MARLETHLEEDIVCDPNRLSPMQLHILKLRASGFKMKEIAESLGKKPMACSNLTDRAKVQMGFRTIHEMMYWLGRGQWLK